LTGLSVSAVGFGGYRIGRSDPSHRLALRAALAGGVNLIDTSSNYMLGDSERLVGEVLAEGLVPRDEVVVVTKIGYLQGPNLELAVQREAEGRPFPEMVKYADGVWHCIHPEFLADQLGRALERLGLETIDLLLLHNPEYFLSAAAHHRDGPPLSETREAFYDRLRRAFAYLDTAVAAGQIGAYGVSSNSCVAPAEALDVTSVDRIYDASGGRLSVLQLPYNLLERGALLERNTPDGTALAAAASRGLGVLVNRPLNATGRGGLVRLADPPRSGAPGSDEALRMRLDQLAEQEVALATLFPDAPPAELVGLIRARWDLIGERPGFAQFFRGELLPAARRTLNDLQTSVQRRPEPDQAVALQAYQTAVNELIERLQARAQRQNPGITGEIRAAIEPYLPPSLRNESLSRLALAFVASTPGVSCVLCGMRNEAYVADALGVMTLPPLPDVMAVARALGTTAD
jgi:aryl-alcohol dehydrogenase-like predicted oxidoreductase